MSKVSAQELQAMSATLDTEGRYLFRQLMHIDLRDARACKQALDEVGDYLRRIQPVVDALHNADDEE